jgi:hypothetical protein
MSSNVFITKEVNDKLDEIKAKHKGLRKEGLVNAIFKLNLWDDKKVKEAIAYAYADGNLGATATENKP